MSRGLGSTQKKLLILLLGGASMAFSYSPFKQYEILREMEKEWEKVSDYQLKRSLESLCKSELILKKINKNGNIMFRLTEKGIENASEILLGNLLIEKNKKWDKKWRVIIFDIPEKFRSSRNSIRYRLNKLGFKELQKSVFVHPFECFDIVSKMVDFYNIKNFVRFLVVESIDNEKYLKKYFDLT
jgi:DNA-binding transcriptional regulator PaaX